MGASGCASRSFGRRTGWRWNTVGAKAKKRAEVEIDVEKLRGHLLDYFGSATFGGFPAAINDLCEIEEADGLWLCEKAEQMGIDLRKFEA